MGAARAVGMVLAFGITDRSSTPNHPWAFSAPPPGPLAPNTAEGAACAGARSRPCCRGRVNWAIDHRSIGPRPSCSTRATHSDCRDLREHPQGGAIQVPPSMATGRRRAWKNTYMRLPNSGCWSFMSAARRETWQTKRHCLSSGSKGVGGQLMRLSCAWW